MISRDPEVLPIPAIKHTELYKARPPSLLASLQLHCKRGPNSVNIAQKDICLLTNLSILTLAGDREEVDMIASNQLAPWQQLDWAVHNSPL